jgi:hypothetical protein
LARSEWFPRCCRVPGLVGLALAISLDINADDLDSDDENELSGGVFTPADGETGTPLTPASESDYFGPLDTLTPDSKVEISDKLGDLNMSETTNPRNMDTVHPGTQNLITDMETEEPDVGTRPSSMSHESYGGSRSLDDLELELGLVDFDDMRVEPSNSPPNSRDIPESSAELDDLNFNDPSDLPSDSPPASYTPSRKSLPYTRLMVETSSFALLEMTKDGSVSVTPLTPLSQTDGSIVFATQ